MIVIWMKEIAQIVLESVFLIDYQQTHYIVVYI